jgi:outer membrane protein assembly factor BamB
VSSDGEAVALNPKTGATEKTLKIGAPVLLSPIAVGHVYVVTDDAQVVASANIRSTGSKAAGHP